MSATISGSGCYSIWSVPLFAESTNKQIVIEFVSPTTHPLYIDEKNPKSKTKTVNEYSIQIVGIDNRPISKNAIAIARTEQLEYGGKILAAIEYEGETYLPEDGIYYWFPNRPKQLKDGSIQIQLQNTTELDSIYAYPLYSIPFMDLTGAFRYEYIAVAYTKNTGETQAYHKIRRKLSVTLIEPEPGNKFTAMIDNATGIAYSIERTTIFREISDIQTQK
jgi:hypothetical protein